MKQLLSGLIVVFALLLLSNCTTQTKTPENVQREWMLVQFQDFSKDLMVSSRAHLNLTKQKESTNHFSANMGCNTLFGNVLFTPDNKVKFSEIASTEMYCDKSMDLETAFAKELETITHYKVEGHYLTLSNSNGMRMKFIAADWD